MDPDATAGDGGTAPLECCVIVPSTSANCVATASLLKYSSKDARSTGLRFRSILIKSFMSAGTTVISRSGLDDEDGMLEGVLGLDGKPLSLAASLAATSSGKLTRPRACSIFLRSSMWFCARKGGLPTLISYRTAPTDHRSAFASYFS